MGNTIVLPIDARRLSHRERDSFVFVSESEGYIYKHAPKFIIDNEYYFLSMMAGSGFVPAPVELLDIELIRMPYIRNEPVKNPEKFLAFIDPVLEALEDAICRHGDLTTYSVLVRNDKPVIIDFGESRILSSPIPDKRREGDRYWLTRTMHILAGVPPYD